MNYTSKSDEICICKFQVNDELLLKDCKIRVNNQNKNVKSDVLYDTKYVGVMTFPDTVIVNGDTTIVKRRDEKVVLKRAQDDEMNLEYAFLYAYFLLNSGMSKNKASALLASIRQCEGE